MINTTGLTNGPNDTELLIADIQEWKDKRINDRLDTQTDFMATILASELAASKLLTRAIELL